MDCIRSNPPVNWELAAKLNKCIWKCDAKFAGQLLGDAIAQQLENADCFARIGALCSQKSKQ